MQLHTIFCIDDTFSHTLYSHFTDITVLVPVKATRSTLRNYVLVGVTSNE